MALIGTDILASMWRPNGSGGDLMDTALDAALRRGAMTMAEQPIVPVSGADEERRWVELLARPSVNGARLATEAFMQRGVDRGVARELDLLILRTGLDWLGRNPDVRLCSLNVSGESLSQKRFLKDALSTLERSGVDPGRVCIEVTESVPVRDFRAAREFARELRGTGCKMALDDFGGGSSNMFMLVPLEMDFIKIDGRFIQPMPEREDYRKVVRGVVAFAREIGLETVAECVEGPEHWALAREMNMDYVQGYHNHGAPRMILPEGPRANGLDSAEPECLAPGQAR